MAGLQDMPMDPVELPRLNPASVITAVFEFHPKCQSFAFLIVSACLFAFSGYFKKHLEDEGSYFLDLLLFFLVLIALPRAVVRARHRVTARLGRCGFAIFKGLFTIIFFAAFHELGKKLMAERDLFIAIASVSFFIHLLFLRVIHEISDDLGIAQGVLLAAFTILLAEYPKLMHIVFLSSCFTGLLAFMNTLQPPREPIPAEPVIPVAAPVIPEQVAIQMHAVPRQPNRNLGENQNSRWRLPHVKSARW